MAAGDDTRRTGRFEPARRRVRATRWALVVAAAAGFGTTVLLARAAHPGTAASSGVSTATAAAEDASTSDSTSSSDLFGSGAIAMPSSGSGSAQPSVQTRTS